jgi:hypothetical protein
MEIRTVRKPGDPGTRKLLAQYGERLVCIRYRYDAARRKRFKTIELIVTEEDWHPPAPHPEDDGSTRPAPKRYATRRLGIRIAYDEADLRQRIKAAGGLWDPSQRMWFLPEEEVRRLGLVQRVAKQ